MAVPAPTPMPPQVNWFAADPNLWTYGGSGAATHNAEVLARDARQQNALLTNLGLSPVGGGNLGGSGVGSADSGHDFGGNRGPGPGARGPENALTHAVDAIVGSPLGFLGPLGFAAQAAIQAANPQATPSFSSFLGSLFGISPSSVASGIGLGASSPGGWGNIGVTGDPSARDFAADPNRDVVGGSGLGSASDGSGSTSGTGRGTGTGSGTGEGGSERGYAMGGIVNGFAPFAPWQDNKLANVRSGEAILPEGLTNALGRNNVMDMIRRYRQNGFNPVGRSVMLGAPGVSQILGR